MDGDTVEAHVLREAIGRHRAEVYAILDRYGARNPRIFGSVARGDATAASDIDLLVDLDPQGGICNCPPGYCSAVSRDQNERFSDILAAIERCHQREHGAIH